MQRVLNDKFFWLIGIIVLILAAASISDVFVYIPDSARYLVWAESLSEMKGFVDDSGPDPYRYVVHAPLYALLLVPAALVFPGSVAAAKMLTALMALGLVLLLVAFLSDRIGRPPAMLAALVLVVNPLFLLFSTQILSDVPFAALFVGLLMMTERISREAPKIDGLLLVYAGLVTAAMLLREVGVALVFACGLYFLTRKEFTRAAVVILIPLAVYALWVVRNEVFIAGVEQPALRNSDLFLSHLYTSKDASLIAEFAARISSNLEIYGTLSGKLLFLTQYDVRGYGIIRPGESLFGWILQNGRFLVLPLSALTAGFFLYGIWESWKRFPAARLAVFFLCFYIPLILVYPFNDIRFLFPLLILMLLFGAIGVTLAIRGLVTDGSVDWKPRVAGGVCLILLMLPNAAWVHAFVTTNLEYRDDPRAYFQSVATRPDAPELLLFPMSEIGTWIAANTEDRAVIGSRWKQLSFWIGDRKLMEMNPLLPLEYFEHQVRDYGIDYLVVLIDRSRLREFETQMALSSRFSFRPVQRIGNAVILKIEKGVSTDRAGTEDPRRPGTDMGFLDSLSQSDERIQFLFRRAIEKMEGGSPLEAEEILSNLSTRAGRSGTVVLHTAIARSFAGEYRSADTLLRNLREGQQAGPLLIHSWYHLQINERLTRASDMPASSGKADVLTRAAGDYWSLGFRQQADRVIQMAMAADPGFAPALVFAVYFSLQQGDTSQGIQRLETLRRVAPVHGAIGPFGEIFANADSASGAQDPRLNSLYRERVANAYLQLGLLESAIDELLQIRSLDPTNAWALRVLCGIYIDKGRFEPARRALVRFLETMPDDDEGRKNLVSRFSQRWGESHGLDIRNSF